MVEFSIKAASDIYRSQVVQSGIASIRSGASTQQVISSAAQTTISTVAGVGGAAVCGAVTAGIGAAVCGPVVAAVAGALVGIINSIFGGGPPKPNYILLKKNECENSAKELEAQYLVTMLQLLDLEYQLWPDRKQADQGDATFQPFKLTGYVKMEPVGLRETNVSIKRWNLLAGALVTASSAEAAYWGLPDQQLLFPARKSWNYGGQQVQFPELVRMNPIAASAPGSPAACFSLIDPMSARALPPRGAFVWERSLVTRIVAAQCKTTFVGKVPKCVPYCKEGEVALDIGPSTTPTCVSAAQLYAENPILGMQQFIELLQPSATLLKPATDRVIVEKYAEKSAQAIIDETLRQQDFKTATAWLTANENYLVYKQGELHDTERDLDDAEDTLRAIQEKALDIRPADMQARLDAAARNTRLAWFAAGAIVLGATVVAWRRA